MRTLVLSMMTTLNGRLDDPGAWVDGVSDDQYEEIDRRFEDFDAIIIGSNTYREMLDYWPGALTAEQGFADSTAEINQRMARKMNDYKKYVVTRHEGEDKLEWNNAERAVATNDEELVAFVETLKAAEGGKIHLAGGATLAQEFVRLDLIDEYRFLVYPLTSPGAAWFDTPRAVAGLEPVETHTYSNGVVALHYRRPG
jgi:dihydrofolate reductase